MTPFPDMASFAVRVSLVPRRAKYSGDQRAWQAVDMNVTLNVTIKGAFNRKRTGSPPIQPR